MTSSEFHQLLIQHKLFLSSKGTKGKAIALAGEDFSNSKFPKVDFSKSTFIECDFSDTIFTNCIFDSTLFKRCQFNNTIFINCTFNNSEIVSCIFSNPTFNKTTITYCDLRLSHFYDVHNLDSVMKFLRIGKNPIETPDFFLT